MRPFPLQLNLAVIKGVTHISIIDFRSYLALERHGYSCKGIGRPEESTGELGKHPGALGPLSIPSASRRPTPAPDSIQAGHPAGSSLS